MLLPFLKEANYIENEESLSPAKNDYIKEIVKLMQGRIKNFSQFIDYADYFFVDKIDIEPQAFDSVLNKNGVPGILQALQEKLSLLEHWDEESIENAVREVASSLQIKGGQIIHPTRVALSGKKVGPGLFELMVVLGQDKTIKRLQEAIEKIEEVKK
jgi:glutamyl/glutaminyl-tRNA synthetase